MAYRYFKCHNRKHVRVNSTSCKLHANAYVKIINSCLINKDYIIDHCDCAFGVTLCFRNLQNGELELQMCNKPQTLGPVLNPELDLRCLQCRPTSGSSYHLFPIWRVHPRVHWRASLQICMDVL